MEGLKETKVTLNIPTKGQKTIFIIHAALTMNDDALFYRPCHFLTNVTQYHKMKPEGVVKDSKLSHLYGEYHLPKCCKEIDSAYCLSYEESFGFTLQLL